jgi:class 3 adenylate cyclase
VTARRLAAILAADVVGYSRLLGADEAGTLTRLRALRREVVEPLATAQMHTEGSALVGRKSEAPSANAT